jgi:OOP family OmpA-OmpF porin
MAGLKTRYKVVGIGILALGGVFGLKSAVQHGLIPAPAALKAMIPQKADIATLGGNIQIAPTQTYDLSAAPEANAPKRTFLMIPWQGGGALTLANGGAGDASGTLMQKFAGSNVNLQRQDDYGKMQEQLLKFASGFKAGQANPDGAAYVQIMGDGGPAFFAGVEPQMEKLGLHLKIVGVTGFSHGEDKCMAPDVNGDPNKARGDLIAAVPRDGDWNICVKWASDNNIPINTDNTVYDPTAINFVDTDSFTQADDKFIAGAYEDRDEAKNGIKTGKRVHVQINGVATWTPGDVTVMEKKGGVVSLASTKDYDQQMPAVIIGIKEEMDKHPAFVTGMLRAVDRASFQVRTTSDGVQKMSETEAKVFGSAGGDEAKPEYWARFFNGFDSPDGKVKLGGSRVSTLAEIRDFMGMGTGTLNVYQGVWNVFGDYDKTFYPKLVPSYPKFADVVDTSYIKAALNGVQMTAPTSTAFSTQKTMSATVSKKAVSIEFDNGKATIRPTSRAQLVDIANQSGMTSLLIRIEGHTDNTGNPDANVALSRARAQAVATALTNMAPATFPATRMEVRGYGDTKPVNDTADQNSPTERAKNRRVEVILGN